LLNKKKKTYDFFVIKIKFEYVNIKFNIK
jgi:hypothetical protein